MTGQNYIAGFITIELNCWHSDVVKSLSCVWVVNSVVHLSKLVICFFFYSPVFLSLQRLRQPAAQRLVVEVVEASRARSTSPVLAATQTREMAAAEVTATSLSQRWLRRRRQRRPKRVRRRQHLLLAEDLAVKGRKRSRQVQQQEVMMRQVEIQSQPSCLFVFLELIVIAQNGNAIALAFL